MINTCVLVGFIKGKPEVISDNGSVTKCSLIVETDKPFQENDGKVLKDVFDVQVWRGRLNRSLMWHRRICW